MTYNIYFYTKYVYTHTDNKFMLDPYFKEHSIVLIWGFPL